MYLLQEIHYLVTKFLVLSFWYSVFENKYDLFFRNSRRQKCQSSKTFRKEKAIHPIKKSNREKSTKNCNSSGFTEEKMKKKKLDIPHSFMSSQKTKQKKT